jgi:chromate transporter
MKPVSLARLTGVFLRTGNLTFGGGDPTMAALYTQLVEDRRWLPSERYGLAYALARITPGTNVLAFAAGAAYEIRGWAGAVGAVIASATPSAVVVVMLSAGYEAWKQNPRVMAVIGGAMAAAVGMMLTGAWQLLAPHFAGCKWRRAMRATALAGGAFLLTAGFRFSPVSTLALAALAGALWQGEPE